MPVPISSIFSFKIVERAYENRNRGNLLTAREYWEFFFSSFFFELAYQRFSEVEFFKFYHQDITIIDKNGFLEISIYENVHQNPKMKVWTNIFFRAAPNLPKEAFLYYLTHSAAPSRRDYHATA